MLWDGNECEKNQGNENLNETIPSTDYNKPETTTECGTFQPFKQNNNK